MRYRLIVGAFDHERGLDLIMLSKVGMCMLFNYKLIFHTSLAENKSLVSLTFTLLCCT